MRQYLVLISHTDYSFLNLSHSVEPLTYLEELRVHTVKVADEEDSNRTGGIEKQQITSCEIQDEPSTMNHHQTHQLRRHDHPNNTTRMNSADQHVTGLGQTR